MQKPPSNAIEILGVRLKKIMEMEEALIYNKSCSGCGREVESFGVAVWPFATWQHVKAPISARMPEKIYCDACNAQYKPIAIRMGYQLTDYKKRLQ